MRESGQMIADYQIVLPLSENQLFEAYQVSGAGLDLAKLLLVSVEQLQDKGARQAFLARAKSLQEHVFPGLCGVLAAETNFLQSYCIYPLPQGQALQEQLTGAYPPRQALALIRQLAEYLAPAHAAGFWHGTLSPASIYTAGEQVSIDQFALASLLPLDFHSGVDPCYSCPELVRGEALSAAADQYSLGILLYRLLTGRVPFQADEPFATAMLHLQETVPPLPESLAVLQPILDGLLQPDPLERWGAMQLVSELEPLLQTADLELMEPVTEPVSPDAADGVSTEDNGEVLELADEDVEEGIEEETSNPLVSDSDLATRIEQRLQERVAQAPENDAAEAEPEPMPVESEPVAAPPFERPRKQETNQMQYRQRNSGSSRFVVLIAAGVAVGIVLYYTLFGGFEPAVQPAEQLPTALETGLEAGSRQLQAGELAAAEKTFSGLVDRFGLYPQPYNNLAAVYVQQGNLEQARDLLERAMATAATYAVVYRNLGTVYSEMARDSYGRALQIEPGQQTLALQLFGGEQLAMNAKVSSAAAATDTAQDRQEEEVVATATPAAVAPETVSAVEQVVSDAVTSVVAKVTAAADSEPVVEEVLPIEPEAAEEVLQRWAAAWSAQDVPGYLKFYAPEYVPPAGRSREQWEQQRQQRLTRPASIKVILSNFVPLEQSTDRVLLEVTQSYQSDRYADRTRKQFELVRAGSSWQILRERSLGRVQ